MYSHCYSAGVKRVKAGIKRAKTAFDLLQTSDPGVAQNNYKIIIQDWSLNTHLRHEDRIWYVNVNVLFIQVLKGVFIIFA